jgi:hypothetical protein
LQRRSLAYSRVSRRSGAGLKLPPTKLRSPPNIMALAKQNGRYGHRRITLF